MGKGKIAGFIVAALALLNAFLAIFGASPLAIDGNALGEAVSVLVGTVGAIFIAVKNLNYSQAALSGQKVTDLVKAGVLTAEEAQKIINEYLQNGRPSPLQIYTDEEGDNARLNS